MSASPPPLRQGDVLARKYEVDSALGAGPQGSSWLARSLTSSKKYVIKLLNGPPVSDSAASAMVTRLDELNIDALPHIIDTGDHQGQRWIAYEYVEGDSLRRLLDEYAGQRKTFTLQDTCQILVKVLEAADGAHKGGLIHRHLKPSNVVVQSRTVGPGQGKVVRTVRVLGLGFSELLHPSVLQEGAIERSNYMAPEVSNPAAGGSPQADVYSVGVMFYELLCGMTPSGTYLSPTQIRDDLPKHVDDIVDLALASNAEDRYPTARDMINDIQRTFTDEDKPNSAISKRTLAVVIGGTIALVVVAAGVLFVTDPDAGARRKDEQLRAEIARSNPIPSADVIKQKLVGHEDMVYIPEGDFVKGRLNSEDGRTATAKEPLAEKVRVPAYYIDRFEWENQKGGHAMVNLKIDDAEAACASRGKRLCNADEWERACKGPENRIYSYGDTFDPAACGAGIANDTDKDLRSDYVSGSLESCKSGWGVYDMSGGSREWTSNHGSNDRFRLVKGGKIGDATKASRCAFVEERSGVLTDRTIGFRCCLDEGAPAPTNGAAPTAPPAPAPGG